MVSGEERRKAKAWSGGGARVCGYAWVSAQSQSEERQLQALRALGVDEHAICVEKQPAGGFDRPIYRWLTQRLREGDTLVVKSIDRLGFDYNETLDEWRRITKEIKARIVVLDMPLLDTRDKDVGSTGEFVADLVYQVLSYVARAYRATNLVRQAEGIAAAKARRVQFGRPPRERPANFEEYAEKFRRGEVKSPEAAAAVGVSRATFIRWARGGGKAIVETTGKTIE